MIDRESPRNLIRQLAAIAVLLALFAPAYGRPASPRSPSTDGVVEQSVEESAPASYTDNRFKKVDLDGRRARLLRLIESRSGNGWSDYSSRDLDAVIGTNIVLDPPAGRCTLTAEGTPIQANVPEPRTSVLLGLGLLAVALGSQWFKQPLAP